MDKFTKITLASAISFAFAAQANAAAYTHSTMPIPAEPFFNGFYIGAGASVVGANAETTTTHEMLDDKIIVLPFPAGGGATGFTLTDVNNIHQGDNIGKYGFGAHVFGGFGQVMNSTFYLGGELFANYFSPQMKQSFNSVLEGEYTINPTTEVSLIHTITTKVKNQWSYGGDIRLGYLISPKTMFYVLFGLDYSKFKVESMGTAALPTGPSIPGSLPIVNNFNKSKWGYIPGVGLETVLNDNDNFTLRAEYRHAFYSSFEKTVYGERALIDFLVEQVPPPEPGDLFHSMTTKVKPNRGVFSLNLSYYLK